MNAKATIILDIRGTVCLVEMSDYDLETIEYLIKRKTNDLTITDRTQAELERFLKAGEEQ